MDGHGGCACIDRRGPSEAAMLSVLLNSDGGCIWSVEELARELGSPRLQVLDDLASLEGAGLVHRCEEFAFATRAAWRFDGLDM